MMEDVFQSLLLYPQTRHEFIVTSQWRLILQIHTSHHGIDAFLVHFGKTQSTMPEKEMTRMLNIVQIVGIVDDTLNVALVVANLHTGFKGVFVVLHSVLFQFSIFNFL